MSDERLITGPLVLWLVNYYMSSIMRKSAFCICENKAADQQCSNGIGDQRLCFHHIDSMIPVLHKSKMSSL